MTGITTKPLTYVTADGKEFTDPVEASLHQELIEKIDRYLLASDVPATRHKLMRDRILGWVEFDRDAKEAA